MSAAEYLAWERDQGGKHEFRSGAVFAMAGGSPRHNLLAAAAGAELRAALRGKGRHVLSSDQRIATRPGERYVYADAVAVFGGASMGPLGGDVLANPTIVVELLSPGTEAHDRGEKWEAYQRIPSLSDYLLVAQAAVRIEHYRRGADGSWRYRLLAAGDEVVLANGARVAVDAVYEGAFEIAAD